MAQEISQPSTHDEGADCYSCDQPRQEINEIPFEELLLKELGGSKSDETRNQQGESNNRSLRQR